MYGKFGLGSNVINGPVISDIKASSQVIAAQTNFAYEVIKDKLSLSLGARVMYGVTISKGQIYALGGSFGGYMPLATGFHADQRGIAYGFAGGISAKPVKELTLGVTGNWNSPLRLKTESSNFVAFSLLDKSNLDGRKKHEQVPATLGAGAAYQIQGGIQIVAHYTYYFN